MPIKLNIRKYFKIFFVVLFLFILIRSFQLIAENSSQRHKISLLCISNDEHIAQLDEIKYVILYQGENINKNKLDIAIQEYQEMQIKKMRNAGFDYGDIPKVQPKPNLVTGYTYGLKFVFNDQNELVDIKFPFYNTDS